MVSCGPLSIITSKVTIVEKATKEKISTEGRGGFPTVRPRRLRATPTVRRMVRETSLSVDDFIYPLFVSHGSNVRNPIGSMPGIHQFSVDQVRVDRRLLRMVMIPDHFGKGLG